MKLRYVLIVVAAVFLAATMAYGEEENRSPTFSIGFFDVSLNGGAMHVDGKSVMFGNEVHNFLTSITDGRSIENGGWGWSIGGSVGMNTCTPFSDRFWLEAGYWQVNNELLFTRPATRAGTYYFAPLLTITDASVGALFNQIADGDFNDRSWAIDWNLLARKDVLSCLGFNFGVLYGVAFYYYNSDYKFGIDGNELGTQLSVLNNTDVNSFGVGPALGVAVTRDIGCGFWLDARALGKFYYRWNNMDASQLNSGGLSLGETFDERITFNSNSWDPSVDLKLRLSKALPLGFRVYTEFMADFQNGLPLPQFATQKPDLYLGVAERADIQEYNAFIYGFNVGISKSF
jgi:hypothetical protein